MAGAAAAARRCTEPARNVSSTDSTRDARRAERVESTWSRVERRKSAHLCSRCSGGNMYGTSQPLSTRGGCKLYGARHLRSDRLYCKVSAHACSLVHSTVSACGTRAAAVHPCGTCYVRLRGCGTRRRVSAVRPAAGGRQTARARDKPRASSRYSGSGSAPGPNPAGRRVGGRGATPTAPPTSHDPARPDPSPLRPGASPSDAHCSAHNTPFTQRGRGGFISGFVPYPHTLIPN